MMKGVNDTPIRFDQDDRFSIKPYVDGLCFFIRECDTPISIAIQGDWGCGKTSMMNMVRDNLEKEKRFPCVWFDTWQYSQFHMETQMTLTFMRHFIGSFGEEKEASAILGKAKTLLKVLAVNTAQQVAGDWGAGAVEGLFQKGESLDFSQEIVELRKTFRELIAAKVKKEDDRVLFFIDDLDRLQPIVAVELLEILKIFFDCPKCVFILAVDTEVIFQGIKEKYGSSISDEKAKSFFDKIIQLPFQLPVSHYKMDGMIEESLHVTIRSYRDREWYFRTVYLLTEGNPRSIKRLSNAFWLTDKVAESKGIYPEDQGETDERKKVLFLLSGIQLNYPEIYTFITISSSFAFFSGLLKLDNRKMMRESLEALEFPCRESWTDRFLDVMLIFSATLTEYVECNQKFLLYPFVRVDEFCRIVNLDRESSYVQPETDSNLLLDENGEVAEISCPHDMYLYRKMDQVFSYYFKKEDRNAEEWGALDFAYRYSPLRLPFDVDWLFDIQFWPNDVFPTVCLNQELMEEGRPWHEQLLCMQRNLSFWYGKLQEEYGKTAYGDQDFTGKAFLVYSEQQANMLIHDLLVMCEDCESEDSGSAIK